MKKDTNGNAKQGLSLMVILLIPIAIAINIVGGQTCSVLKIPLNMDTIGVILIGALGGPLPAAITGALSNLANGIIDPTYIPYAISAFLIGIAAGELAKHNMMTKLWKMVVSGIVIAIVGAVSGTAVTMIFFGGISGAGDSAFVAALLATGKQLLVSVFSVTIIIEIVGKILSVIITYGIIKAIPARSLVKFPLGMKYIKEENEKES